MVTFSPDLPPLDEGSGRMIPSNSGEISGIFSYLSNRPPYPSNGGSGANGRWPSFSSTGGNRSLWTKYCLLCTVCGSAATILAGIFLVVAALFRHYTTSINYFETVPTYIPAILLSICGVSTIAFSCKRNRNIILLRITACWSLCSAALSSVITITTSLIHMNRLQTLKECVYNTNPPGCSCYSHVFGMGVTPHTYVFENTPDCEVIHGILYSCLRAVFAISVVAVLLSIFLCMLLYQLIGHERKKAYWSRIRRINSDWSADFIACLARPMPRERSSVLPLVMSPSGTTIGSSSLLPPAWGPPPPYEEVADDPPDTHRPFLRPLFAPRPSHSSNRPQRVLRLVSSQSENSFQNSDGLISPSPHPFSPTITSIDPVTVFRHHHELSQSQSYTGISRISNSNSNTTIDTENPHCNPVSHSHSTSSRLAELSMSSITSLSIPETVKSTTSGLSSITAADGELEALEENSTEVGTYTNTKSGDNSTGSPIFEMFESSLTVEGGLGSENVEKPLVAVSEPRIVSNKGCYYYENSESDKALLVSDKCSLSKISSLPCSPLMNIKKRLWPNTGKSVQNLSFANCNFDYENFSRNKQKRRLSRGKPESCLFIRDEGQVKKGFKGNEAEVGISGTKGSSLPCSPMRVKKSKLEKEESYEGIC